MFDIIEKQLLFELKEMKVKDGKLSIKEGTIRFYSYEEDYCTKDYSSIEFNFTPIKVNTHLGTHYINSIFVNLMDNKIRFMNKENNEWIILGEMKDFKEPEEALAILETFIDKMAIE